MWTCSAVPGEPALGVETATLHGQKCAKVVACVNHDANAIASHKANHPETHHFTEDIRQFTEIIKRRRRFFGGISDIVYSFGCL